MANPHPVQTLAVRSQRSPKYGDVALSDPIPTRYSVEIADRLNALDDRQAFIRSAVAKALNGNDLQACIDAVLVSLPLAKRKEAKKLFKMLTERLAQDSP